MQPPIMPRPDIARLGVKYRRIPILAIGRDIYLDTRLILQKLEALYPEKPSLGASAADNKNRALERLLEAYTIDAGIFTRATQLIPTDLPLLKQPAYYKDRADYAGVKLSKEAMDRNRPEAVVEICRALDFLETTLLTDGTDWVLGTERPSLADIEAVWPFHWLTGLPGALPAEHVSPEIYPRVFAWIARFQKAISAAKAATGKPQTLSGEEAATIIAQAPFNEGLEQFDEKDSVAEAEGLKKGATVMLWPTDSGSSHRDVGTILSLNGHEVVIETKGKNGAVRLHAPRHGFRLRKYQPEEGSSKL
jgi:glutathione S-transferase